MFVNIALQEPFGLTLIEAAVHGAPIVATRHGGPVDIINTLKVRRPLRMLPMHVCRLLPRQHRPRLVAARGDRLHVFVREHVTASMDPECGVMAAYTSVVPHVQVTQNVRAGRPYPTLLVYQCCWCQCVVVCAGALPCTGPSFHYLPTAPTCQAAACI